MFCHSPSNEEIMSAQESVGDCACLHNVLQYFLQLPLCKLLLCFLLSLSLAHTAFKKLSTLNKIWRKPMLKFCGSHRLWCLRIDFVVSAFMLTVLCQKAAHCNPHQAIMKNADLFCPLAQFPHTWKCGKYGTIDLPGVLKLMGWRIVRVCLKFSQQKMKPRHHALISAGSGECALWNICEKQSVHGE